MSDETNMRRLDEEVFGEKEMMAQRSRRFLIVSSALKLCEYVARLCERG